MQKWGRVIANVQIEGVSGVEIEFKPRLSLLVLCLYLLWEREGRSLPAFSPYNAENQSHRASSSTNTQPIGTTILNQ